MSHAAPKAWPASVGTAGMYTGLGRSQSRREFSTLRGEGWIRRMGVVADGGGDSWDACNDPGPGAAAALQ